MEGVMLRCVLASLVLPFFPLGVPGAQSSPSAHSRSTLQGILMDVSGVPVPGATVIVEGEQLTRKLITDEKGAFKVELSSGLYRLSSGPWEGFIPATGAISKTAERWASFRPSRRAAFRLQSAAAITINLILIDSMSVSVRYPGQKENEILDDGPTTDISYENISLPVPSLTAPEVVVQFGERHEKGGVIDYKADLIYGGRSVYADPHPGVALSYNLLTIYANQVRFDKRKSKFKAEGNVIVDDGRRTVRVKRAEVVFKGSEPVLKLEAD